MDLTGVVKLSNTYGSNPDLVLAGGGNTSVKTEDTIWVKCSGTQLATITEDGFVAMDRKKLAAILTKEYPAGDQAREAAYTADVMTAKCPGEGDKRPSVEVLLHHLFPQTYILHVHPAMVNGLTCGRDGEALARQLLGEELIWIGIVRPGYTLARLCCDEMAAYKARTGKDANLILMQNHGIFFAGNDLDEIAALVHRVMHALEAHVSRKPDLSATGATADALVERLAKLGGAAHFVDARDAIAMALSRETAAPLLRSFTPDHIVYYGAFPLYTTVETLEADFAAHTAATGTAPKVVIIEGVGIFTVADTEKNAATAELLLRDAVKIAIYSESFGGPLHMTDDLVEFILHWEAESYRKKQN